jgi:hypothetical protein
VNDLLSALLGRIWKKEIKDRPSMVEVASLLALPKYWVAGTDAVQFKEYAEFVDREEGRIYVPAQEMWEMFLTQSASATDIGEQLADDPEATDLIEKMVRAIGIICGNEGTPTTDGCRGPEVVSCEQ